MENINKPSKEDIIEYYINQLHTKKQCVEYFNVSMSGFDRLLKEYNIKKTKENIINYNKKKFLNRIPTKEELEEYYIKQEHTVKETAEFFNASFVQMEDWLYLFKLSKTPEAKKVSHQKANRKNSLLYNHDFISKIRYYYIQNNDSLLEVLEKLNSEYTVSYAQLIRCIKKYNLHKDQEQIGQKQKKEVVLPSYEELYQYYVIEGHTQKECHEHFSVCINLINKLVKEWGLLARDKCRCKNQQTKEWVPPLSKEKIIETYITTTISGKEAAIQLGVSFSVFRKCLNYYHLHKDLELVQASIKNAWKQKYSEGHPLRNKEVQEKIKQTCLEKYGTENPAQNQEIINKIKEKTIKKIPVSYEEFYNYYITNNHSREECGEHFGVPFYTIEDWIRKFNIQKSPMLLRTKIEQTNLEKYGYKSPTKNKAVVIKSKNTPLARYGTNNPAQAHIQHYEFWDADDHFYNFIINLTPKQSVLSLSKYFNLSFGRVMDRIHQLKLEQYILYKQPRSHYEDEIIEMLHKEFNITNIELNKRGLLPSGKEIDIYLPDYKVGIEFNGEYWHCDLHEKFQDHSGRSHYHQDKSLEAEGQGIFLFHIFEHEWDEMWTTKNSKFQNSHENIINRLGNILTQAKNHIPARKCEIREITKEQKKEFLNKNHIQGNEYTGSYILGLFYENKLVSCMCFGHSKFSRYNYELTRFATVHDTIVQGGASKLFKYFVKNKMKEGEKIVSYNDITKTRGNIYKILGFECVSINEPNYWWVNFDTMDIRSRYQEQEAGEVERMHSQGYHRICDCGTRTWVYTKK